MISGFRASDIGQYGIGDLSWWTNPTGFGDPWDIPVPMGVDFNPLDPFANFFAGTFVPPIPFFAPTTTSRAPNIAVGGVAAVPFSPPAEEIAAVEPYPSWEEQDAPAGIYETTRAETDWDAVYEQYVELNAPAAGYDLEEEPMAHDWGHVLRQGIGAIWPGGGNGMGGGMGLAAPQTLVAAPAVAPGLPTGVTIDPRTGKVVCKRRRRRRLLTEGDFNDLMRIATLPNKDTVKVALAKAVGRR